MTKTTFTADTTGRVTLSYDQDGERVTRDFSCPVGGGYVIEFRRNGSTQQVCRRLSSMGETLYSSSRAGLLDLIRREYRAMRAAQKRAEAAY